MPFLDKTGLAHLWNQIVARLNTKAEKTELDAITDAKADWSQNDSTALDYVKNRTHYVDGSGEVIYEGTITQSENLNLMNTLLFTSTIISGNSYVVVYDGITYVSVAFMDADNYLNIGASYGTNSYDYSEFPFNISVGNTTGTEKQYNCLCSTAGDHTITVMEGAVYQLDEMFIPSTIARITDIPDTSAFMLSANPTGTGSFSMNRLAGTTVGAYSSTFGQNCEASKARSHAEGNRTIASGLASHAEGYYTTASGDYSHAEGDETTASGLASHAEGCCTTANAYQHVSGKYNTAKDGPVNPDTQDSTGDDALFIVGYGTSTAAANAFRIASNGKCKGVSSFSGSGADFAELFEWADGNPDNEDRRGLFVALDCDKIKLANDGDDYIGVISSAQAFIGNAASEEWQGKYLTDIFGAKISQTVEIPATINEETGEVITPARTTTQFVVNPDYDPDAKYVMRESRKEWGIVGLLGQVVIIDDGTCVVGGYAKPTTNGIGTAANEGYRVMKRIDENHIKVLVK